MANIIELQNRIHKWAGKVVPNRQPVDAAIKLVSEVSELLDAIHSGQGSVEDEIGDVMILIIDIASLVSICPVQAAMKKMTANESREWANVGGVLRHAGGRHEDQ